MTLTTRMRIVEPYPVRQIFNQARRILGAEHARYEEIEAFSQFNGLYPDNPRLQNILGQGYAAILCVEWGGDSWLNESSYNSHENCTETEHSCPPQASIEVNFNTAYCYQADNSAGSNDLHAWLVGELGQWLDSYGLTWFWCNEYTGEWHKGSNGLAQFGNAERGALRQVA